ncbi:hypothetical protein GA830_12060 [Mesorhizobium sp. NBSH29]|uniref:hypothetical protein n=1 Tax=Mesorhizobium sp. NBSH29 TaxID=2654249 RepID=UPI0018966282|nr:hypothetical protein [Mesorhizobium sp. NBSH29]QPC87392.1 hypothetical protein GA830_12060 [Mesorhizobium sp. NBSH29]
MSAADVQTMRPVALASQEPDRAAFRAQRPGGTLFESCPVQAGEVRTAPDASPRATGAVVVSDAVMILLSAVAAHERMSIAGIVGQLASARAEAIGLGVLARAIADRGELTEVPLSARLARNRHGEEGS